MPVRFLPLTFVFWLVPVATAFAEARDNGEGWAGETNDKVVTFVCLGLIVGFPLFVTLATLLQTRLEKRKEARKAAELQQRIGW